MHDHNVPHYDPHTNSMWETEAQKVNVTTHQYFNHPFSVKLSCVSLARGLKIIAVKVREDTSTNARNGFSQLRIALLESRPWPPSLRRSTAAQEFILSRWSFQRSTFTLAVWMVFLRQAIYFSIFPEQFFLTANTSFSQVFLHYHSRADLMTHN